MGALPAPEGRPKAVRDLMTELAERMSLLAAKAEGLRPPRCGPCGADDFSEERDQGRVIKSCRVCGAVQTFNYGAIRSKS